MRQSLEEAEQKAEAAQNACAAAAAQQAQAQQQAAAAQQQRAHVQAELQQTRCACGLTSGVACLYQRIWRCWCVTR